MRPGARGALLALAAGLLLAPHAARAWTWPALEGTAGATFGIAGSPSEGGPSLSVAATWPVQAGMRFGLMVSADDMGSAIGRLRDPNDGTDLGAVAEQHRGVVGAGWRLDVMLPAWRSWTPYASGTWGWYRVGDDVRGRDARSASAAGVSAGAGVRHPLRDGLAVGASVRWHALFDDRLGHYVAAGADWSWR